MSAPTVACAVLDACAPLILEAQLALGGTIAISHTTDPVLGNWWSIFVHVGEEAFHGSGDTPSRALMMANSKRQDFEEAAARRVAA